MWLNVYLVDDDNDDDFWSQRDFFIDSKYILQMSHKIPFRLVAHENGTTCESNSILNGIKKKLSIKFGRIARRSLASCYDAVN